MAPVFAEVVIWFAVPVSEVTPMLVSVLPLNERPESVVVVRRPVEFAERIVFEIVGAVADQLMPVPSGPDLEQSPPFVLQEARPIRVRWKIHLVVSRFGVVGEDQFLEGGLLQEIGQLLHLEGDGQW